MEAVNFMERLDAMTDEKTRLLEALDLSRAAMLHLIQRLDPKEEIYPNWTLQQFLAHVSGWDEAASSSLRAYVKNEEAPIASYRGIDAYNAESVETRHDLTYEQTYREWELARIELKAALLALPDDSFSKTILYPWGTRASVTGLVEVIIDHEHEHVEEIEKLKFNAGDGG
jgi:hypothetical protein